MDPNATHAWNATIRGRKRWIFYPPGVPPPGVHPSSDADSVALPLTVGEWLFEFWSDHVERLLSAPSAAVQPLECTAFPGDVVFVPHGWWHMVINLDAGLNIAITHNYVSTSNLPNVLKFLRDKQEQISGCRDRAESIKPHQLYETFCAILQRHHPTWLEKALAVPDWTCKAWTGASTQDDINDEGIKDRQSRGTQKTKHGKPPIGARPKKPSTSLHSSSTPTTTTMTSSTSIVAKAIAGSNEDDQSSSFRFSFFC